MWPQASWERKTDRKQGLMMRKDRQTRDLSTGTTSGMLPPVSRALSPAQQSQY